jgi:F420-dependent oxidoreductase-like protein
MQLRIFTEPQQGATYDQLAALARLAEALGFDAFFRSDHFLVMGEQSDGRPGPTDAWITLAGLARDTSTIRLGTLVTSATFRPPGLLAVSVAEVDAMSGGRVELGLGAGWYEAEHTAYGFDFPPTGERFERLEEQLAIVTGLWSTPVGAKFSHSGKHYKLTDSPALPKPVQPTVPIVIGGYGAKRTPRLAAEYASEFNLPFPPVDYYGTAIDNVKAACDAAGRDWSKTMTFSVAQVVCCGRDEAEIGRRARNIGREVDELRQNGAAGTPAEVVERLRAFAAAGASRAYLQVLDIDDHDHLRLLAAEVMPHLVDV